MGKRVDNVIILNDLILVIEFKVGESKYPNHAIEQVIDYSIDLQNFHEGSHNKKIIPILISTKANAVNFNLEIKDNIYSPVKLNQSNLGAFINHIRALKSGEKINFEDWENSIYKPTPTIVEAAQALYKGHNVEEISRSDAGAINLSKTAHCLNEIIEKTKVSNTKSICFVTGVPGAGKTLAGLNIANKRMQTDEDENAVFLSGNGPLVEVLREALVRDEVATKKANGIKFTKKEAAIKANAFIQNIHHFRDDNLISKVAPTEKVVVFDEAQRAWTKKQASSFMTRKKGITDFNMSEPEFLISVMDRHEDWCTIVCLIGGGQEINTGEAGLEEWIDSLKIKFKSWNIYYSGQIINNSNYLSKQDSIDWIKENGKEEMDLHLSVSVRSFRSEQVSMFIENLLDLNLDNAKSIFKEVIKDYPIYLTRDLNIAKKWLLEQRRGSERMGIVASSGARRLRALGIDVKNEIIPTNWFLNRDEDVRSSYFLEEVATEFDIQGLEVDWICLAWGGNLHLDTNKEWTYKAFKGTKWQDIKKDVNRKYLLNSYRVLLTRARQGMIIFIPKGNNLDQTRKNEYYDYTFNYLKKIGINEIETS
jgi:DUF2075 family protein